MSMNHSRSILRMSAICLGATKNFTVLSSSASGVFLMRSTNALEDCSYVEITSPSVSGAFGILPNSIPPSRACSLAFCSVTNIHASSLADLHLAWGFRSALALGYALSTFIVVGTSFCNAPRNCSFSVMASSLRGMRHRLPIIRRPACDDPADRHAAPQWEDTSQVSSRGDLHRRPLDAEPRGPRGAADGVSGGARRGRAPLSGLSPAPALRRAPARRRVAGGGDRLSARPRPGRAAAGTPGLPNTAWRSAAFRGYADHMETPA